MEQLLTGTIAVAPNDGLRRRPLPETQSEAEQLEASIEQAVRRETDGGVRNLRVVVSRARVLLDGRCSTYYTKQRAQHAAMELAGCRELANRIEVV